MQRKADFNSRIEISCSSMVTNYVSLNIHIDRELNNDWALRKAFNPELLRLNAALVFLNKKYFPNKYE